MTFIIQSSLFYNVAFYLFQRRQLKTNDTLSIKASNVSIYSKHILQAAFWSKYHIFAAFDTPITTAPTAGENPSVVVSTTSSDFEVVSSKQTVSSSIIIGVSRSTTKEQSLKPKEPARVAPKIKLGINTSG